MRFKQLLMVVSVALAPAAFGQTFELLHEFQGPDGASPESELVQGSDGNLYGTTSSGGTNGGWGSIYRITPNGGFTALVSFNRTNGANPTAALIQANDGNFYGTTAFGGDLSLYEGRGYGTVFRMTTNGTLTTLVSFDGTNGRAPQGRLFQISGGDFYGTSGVGGDLSLNNGNGYGTIFRMTPTGIMTTLFAFQGSNGLAPYAGVVQGTDGDFYGTTSYGGINDSGTVFKMKPIGTFISLFSFNQNNGFYLPAGLVEGKDGNFYGTTFLGGSQFLGTVFKITTNGSLTTLVSFTDGNGRYPKAGLIQANDGNFYSTTSGNPAAPGTVFRMTPDGNLTTVVKFTGDNGAFPHAGLVQGNDGNLYGTTSGNGGASGNGTIFRILMPVTLNSWASGNELVLSWPTNALGFTLQSASNLNSINWIDSTNVPAIVGGKFTVTNTISGNAEYYRLKK